MAEMSPSFNFDDFDEQVSEALEDRTIFLAHDVCMRLEGEITEYEYDLVEKGWQTAQEAEEHISAWRLAYLDIGIK